MTDGTIQLSIAENARQSLERALKTGRCLVGVWRIEDGKILHNFVALDFPHGDYDQCIRMLRNQMVEQLEAETRKVQQASRGTVETTHHGNSR